MKTNLKNILPQIQLIYGGEASKNDIINFIESIFFIKNNDIYYPNPKLFKFIRELDNIHDFNDIGKYNSKIYNENKQIYSILENYDPNFKIFLTNSNNFESNLFITIYTLIRSYGKLKYNQNNDYYNLLKEYIGYTVGKNDKECLNDNAQDVNTFKNINPLIDNSKLNPNNKPVGKLKEILEKTDEILENTENKYLDYLDDINFIKCKENDDKDYILPKVMDGTGKNTLDLTLKDSVFLDSMKFNLPYYLIYFDDYENNYNKLLLKKVNINILQMKII